MEEACGACPGPPPPQFLVPPPPRPPFLEDGDACSEEAPHHAFEVCDAMPVLDAELHSSPVIPSTAVIVVSSVLLLATLLIVSVLLFKYKRKTPNAAPKKPTTAPGRNDATSTVGGAVGGDLSYEDANGIHPPTAAAVGSPSLQMTDLKASGTGYPNGLPVFRDPSVYIGPHQYISEDLYNPVYEEISHGSAERGETDSELPASEDEFAEDELSLAETAPPPQSPPLHHLAASAGSLQVREDRFRPGPGFGTTGAPVSAASASVTPFYEPTTPDLRYSRSTVAHLPSPPPPAPAPAASGGVRRSRGHRSNDSEFHEGMLLDALLQQLYYQQQQQQLQHSSPFPTHHPADFYGQTPASPRPPQRTLPHVYHHPGTDVFTTLRHPHGSAGHQHHHQQHPQRRRTPMLHSSSALGLS